MVVIIGLVVRVETILRLKCMAAEGIKITVVVKRCSRLR